MRIAVFPGLVLALALPVTRAWLRTWDEVYEDGVQSLD